MGNGAGLLQVVDKGALGDLQNQAVECKSAAMDRSLHFERQIEITKLKSRDVHRKGKRAGNDCCSRKCLAKDRVREIAYQACLFGKRDKSVRWNHAQDRMFPSSKHFEASQLPRAQLHQRLKIRYDFIALQGLGE